MNRISTLPGGCKNLSDTVRIAALDGQQQWPPMTLVAAQKLANDQHAELIHIDTQSEPIFVFVDEAMWSRLGRLELQQMLSELHQTPPV